MVHLISRTKRVSVPLLLALSLSGCAGRWITQPNSQVLLTRPNSPNVRLILARGDTVLVRRAVLRGDTVFSRNQQDKQAVALGDVATVSTWHGGVQRTLGVTVLTVAGTFAALALAFMLDPPLN